MSDHVQTYHFFTQFIFCFFFSTSCFYFSTFLNFFHITSNISNKNGRINIMEKLVRRAPHEGEDFELNNAKVFQMLYACTHETVAYAHIKQFARTQNERATYIALVSQYRGQGHNSRERAEAQVRLDRLIWHGKAKNFQFDNFFSIFIGALNDLENYRDSRTETGKVALLLAKTARDQRLSAARTFIQGGNLINDFEGAVNYLAITHHRAVNNVINQNAGQRRIAALGRQNSRQNSNSNNDRNESGGQLHPGAPKSIEDRVNANGILLNDGGYSTHVWRNLMTQSDRDYCTQMRNRHRNNNQGQRNGGGGGRGRGGGGRGNGGGRGIAAIETEQQNDQQQQQEGNDQ